MTSTVHSQAFAVRYIRQIGTNDWIVTVKPVNGFENVKSRGVVAWTTAHWESETKEDESFLGVTVIVEGETEATLLSEARRHADRKLMDRHPGAIIREDESTL